MGQNLLPLTGNSLDNRILPRRLREELQAIAGPIGEFSPRFGDDGCPCVWLDRATGKCRHYRYRPSVCRELKVGSEACLRIRATVR